MSDFLLREKEFLKLNEELNKKTKTALEKKIESSKTSCPRSGEIDLYSRRASIEVEKLNIRTSSRVSTIKNCSVSTSESRRNRGSLNPQNSRLSPNSRILSKGDNASQTLKNTQGNSKVSTPKSVIENLALNITKSEKPPVKPKVMSQTRANTVPRNSRDSSKPNRTVLERELHKINAKLNERTKRVLEDAKENMEKLKLSPPRNIPSPRTISSPKAVQSPLSTGRKTPPALIKRTPRPITETYRNKNFKESPSTEALSVHLNSPTSETKDSTARSELAAKTKKEVASCKKPLKPLPVVSDKVTKKNVSTDGLIKYLKSKLSIIQLELEENITELKKKTDELHASYETQKKLEIQRDQAISKNSTLMEQLNKLEEKLLLTERKLKGRESECATTTREVEALKREVRVISQANANLEKRLYKANEELENAKNNIASMKEAERDLKDSVRQDKEVQEKQIKTLRKQRSELLSAYKKQLYLIDNLRRQNVCMEQAKMISFGEKEFAKILEWNVQN